METKLTREASFYNPFFFNGREIECIKFIDGGRVVAVSRWLSDGNNPFNEIVLPFEIKKALKEDLNKKTAFCMTFKNDYSNILKWVVYIPVSLVGGVYGEHQTREDWQNCHTWQDLTISVNGIKNVSYLDDNRQLKYNAVNGVFSVKLCAFWESKRTAYYNELQTLSEDIKRISGQTIPTFILRDILKEYNITHK